MNMFMRVRECVRVAVGLVWLLFVVFTTACEPSGVLGAALWRQVSPHSFGLSQESKGTYHRRFSDLQTRDKHGYIMRGPDGLCQLQRSVATRD
jgi:hypothetical protein